MNTKWMAATLLAVMVSGSAMAQQTETEKEVKGKKLKKDESIIVRKKGDSNEKITIVVDGEKVSVNGKPIEEFKDENVEIIRSKSRNGYAIATTPRLNLASKINVPMAYSYNYNYNQDGMSFGGNKAVLGVTSDKEGSGAKITTVTKESAAEKAGLKVGDIIKKINDAVIDDSNDLYSVIGKYKPEDKVTITYLRDGKENTTTATLTKAKTISWGNGDSFSWSRKPRIGLQIQDVEEGNGVKVLDVDEETPAAKAGLKEDDIITEIDGKDLKNVDEFKTKTQELKEGDTIKVTYKRNGKSATADIKIPKKLKTANL